MLGSIISSIGSIVGGALGSRSQSSALDKQIALQKDFAKNGIRWKVEDAKAAGVHPLFALGASTIPFQPMAINDTMGPAIGEASQNIGRAISAQSTTEERAM